MALSDAKARKLKPDGKPVSDGTVVGLYLYPAKTAGSGKWIFRFKSPENGKRRDMGLGSYPIVSIRDARTKAFELRVAIDKGIDPLEERRSVEREQKKLASVPNFETAARCHHADKAEAFRSAKHTEQWMTSLEQYVFPKIGKRLVNDLTPADFAACLKPIWLKKAETAARIRQRCDAVMSWAAANGFILASPVAVVDKILPKQPGKRERVEHQPALPWRMMPAFFSMLQEGDAVSRKMLEFLILTACRSGELRQMRWDELYLDDAVWVIPASRMKAKAQHRVPLGRRAIEILEEQVEKSVSGEGLVFPSRTGKPMTDMVLTKFLRDKKIESDTPGRLATAHGFRSSFRDWASEQGYARDLAERALAHTIKNMSEAAYHRTDLLVPRRSMMLDWEAYCLSH